jgi:hypothetical protein
MEKEFIPYKQALALKELGFDEDCFGCYTEKKEVIVRVGDYRSFQNNDSEDVIIRDFNSYENGTVSAPLYQQAFRWFREKYNFDVGIAKDSHNIYHFQIDTNYYGNWILPIFSRIYEEAELECLKKLIEIVKEK